MPNSTLTIHECPFKSRPCENHTCRQAANKKKYFIGNPNVSIYKPIFCEDCINHLAGNLPVELIHGGGDLEARLRAEITAEYQSILEKRVAEVAAAALQAHQIAPMPEPAPAPEPAPEPDAEEEPAEEAAEETPEQSKPVYRCLDCNAEFDNPSKLGSHRRKHKGA